jgi:hypothetical protein
MGKHVPKFLGAKYSTKSLKLTVDKKISYLVLPDEYLRVMFAFSVHIPNMYKSSNGFIGVV